MQFPQFCKEIDGDHLTPTFLHLTQHLLVKAIAMHGNSETYYSTKIISIIEIQESHLELF